MPTLAPKASRQSCLGLILSQLRSPRIRDKLLELAKAEVAKDTPPSGGILPYFFSAPLSDSTDTFSEIHSNAVQALRESLTYLIRENPCLQEKTADELTVLVESCLPKSVSFEEGSLRSLCTECLSKFHTSQRKSKHRSSIPECAFLYDDLTFKADKVEASGHAVRKVRFKPETGIKGIGFFKPCDNETYPPLLAKYAVAISQIYRLSLGKRACDDRLVFNKKGEIIGTVSIAIKDFTPFSDEKTYGTTTDDLIRHNIAELLIAAWRHKEDDLHPGNLGLKGSIDRDMSLYNITNIIKGARPIHETVIKAPREATKLSAKHLESFPVSIGQNTHWPAKSPENGNFTKEYACKPAFVDLKDNEDFRQQMFFALLKELLSFQTVIATNQIKSYLGDLPLDLDELDRLPGHEGQKDRLIEEFGHRCFYHTDGREKTFAEHFLGFAEQEYQEFYQIIIHYPPFKEYLLTTPGLLEKQLSWFNRLKEQIPSLSLDVDKIRTHFERIVRESLEEDVVDVLGLLRLTIDRIGDSVRKELAYRSDISDASLAKRKRTDSDPDMLPHPKDTALLEVEVVTGLQQTYKQLVELYEHLKSLARQFFNKEEPKTSEQIYDFFTELQAKSMAFDNSHLASQAPAWNLQLQNWKDSTRNLCSSVRYNHALKPESVSLSFGDSGPRTSSISTHSKSVKPATKSVISTQDIRELKQAIYNWVKDEKFRTICTIFQDALSSYKPAGHDSILGWANVFSYSRTRVADLRRIKNACNTSYQTKIRACKSADEQQEVEKQAIVELLTRAFENGGWETTSFNFKLTKRIIKKVVLSFRRSIDTLGEASGIYEDSRPDSFPALREKLQYHDDGFFDDNSNLKKYINEFAKVWPEELQTSVAPTKASVPSL